MERAAEEEMEEEGEKKVERAAEEEVEVEGEEEEERQGEGGKKTGTVNRGGRRGIWRGTRGGRRGRAEWVPYQSTSLCDCAHFLKHFFSSLQVDTE